VVQATVELADRDGLSGVTLPKVAKAVGFTPMSLYRYVGSKDELLVLMRDHAISEPPEISAEGPISGPPAGPNQIAWMETALRVLPDTGLDWPEKVGIMMLLSGYVRHTALLAQELGVAGTAAAWTRPRPRSATAGAC
jgi:AcrR family transcriptional regulator